jgi:phosphoribosyl 1,2-cyclic phosphodiesterase
LSRLRFCSLGSGSSGNATLVESSEGVLTTRLLIDCGMPLKLLQERLAYRGLLIDDLDAIFVTHEHSDHVGCLRQIANQFQIPIWMSRGTHHAMGCPPLNNMLNFASDLRLIQLRVMTLQPFTVVHDAKEPLQLRIVCSTKTLGLITDLGSVAPHTLMQLRNLNAVILECNHDPNMLAASNYPPFLKQRILGRFGHLSNQQAAGILTEIAHSGLQFVVAAHLSIGNNSPALVQAELIKAWPEHNGRILLANAEQGFDWLEL